MEFTTIKEFEKVLNEQNYKCIGLIDTSGKMIVPFNPGRIETKQRLRDIEKMLKAPALPDGIYIIRCKNTHMNNNKNAFWDYYIKKGELTEEKLNEQIKTVYITDKEKPENPNVLGYTEVLELKTKLVKFEIENEALKKQLAEYEAEAEEEEEEEEEPETMKDGLTSMIETLAATAIPIFDRFASLKEKALLLEEKKLTLSQNRPAQNSTQITDFISQFKSFSKEDKDEFFKELETLRTENPQKYTEIYSTLMMNNLI